MILDSLFFAIDVTLPISLIIFLGVILKRVRWISDEFAEVGSRLVFNLTLPALLFINIATTDLTKEFPLLLIVIAGLIMLGSFMAFHWLAFAIPSQFSRGAFVQGACRGNMAIIGLALSANAFGEQVLPLASMYLAALVIPVNILSILTLFYHQSDAPSGKTVLLSVLKNPLAIAICMAVIIALLSVKLPKIVIDTGNYLARMTLPLALLCVGASIRLHEFRASRLLYSAITSKIVILPLLATSMAYFCGLRGEELGVLYVMTAAPTAAAAYPMVRSIGGDYHLTAAIIAGSTLFSMFTSAFGLFVLHYVAWV
jgi:malonate transporter and related proteins